jgi:anti-anti-sigma factor
VSFSGEIDVATAPLARTALSEACGAGARTVVVDLSEVSFFGAAGVSVLIEAKQLARSREVKLVFSSPSAIVQRVAQVTGCDELFASEGEDDIPRQPEARPTARRRFGEQQ